MKTFKYILILSLFSTLMACEKEIEFNGKQTQPVLVVNSILSTDSTIVARITQSKFFLENNGSFSTVANADVSLYINDVFQEKLTYQTNGRYISNKKPSNGDVIKLKVSCDGFKDTYCQTTVCQSSNIIHSDTTILYMNNYPHTIDKDTIINGTRRYITDTTGYSMSFRIQFKVTISDPQNIENFYQLLPSTEIWDEPYYLISSIKFNGLLNSNTNDDFDLSETDKSKNSFNVFSDEIFNGKEITLTFELVGFAEIPKKAGTFDYLDIPVLSINKDLYQYYYTYYLEENSDELFSEPIQVYSNVTNGIGIIGSSTNCNNRIRINLKEMAKLPYKQPDSIY